MKKPGILILFVFISLSVWAQGNPKEENPPAPGFNAAVSDPEAIRLADDIMRAMGGRKNWDRTRFIRWTFFGRRTLLWDKKSGMVRIESPADKTVYLVNVLDNSGKVEKDGQLVTHPDSLRKYVDRGKSIWINDSYWLCMPFKLKDSGVALKYLGRKETMEEKPAEVLQLTFEAVGNTPDNKYLVYVDPDTHLVIQWDYFRLATDEKPQIATPWKDYRMYGGILLSGDRGRNQLTDIAVYKKAPKKAFTSFGPVSW